MKMIKSISIVFSFLSIMSSGCSRYMESPKTYAQDTLGIEMRAQEAPPPLLDYSQPECPVDGYLWTPGYWAYSADGYYWVPGVWVSPPESGYLWTPCYWGFTGGYYGFYAGYWGPHDGYYGGVNYGYGYGGSGYYGGRWEGGHFRYNTAVVNVNTTVIHNTYVDRSVIVNNRTVNRTSFNGPGGVRTRPTKQEEVAMRETHVHSTSEQTSHQKVASKNRNQFVSENKVKATPVALKKADGQGVNTQGRYQKARPAKQQRQAARAQRKVKRAGKK